MPLTSSVLYALALAGPTGLVEHAAPTDPVPIVGGNEAMPCQWPAVVAMMEDDETPVLCSGSLVAPGVVMTAAHCVIPERPIVAVGFGEHGQTTGMPQRIVAVTDCVGNPDYYAGQGADVGYCLLAQDVTDVPIVPLMNGCEVDALPPGAEVTIVGYGASYGTVDEFGELQTMGVGPKRYTTQTVDFIDPVFQEIAMYDGSGSQSACFGDSGGPALVQMDDGTWRVFGTGGHLYDPGGLPPPMQPGNICGAGAAYGFAPHVIPWLEANSGVDLTPCWNGDVWAPGPGCADFPLDPDVGAGVWATGCSGGSFGGGGPPVCVEPPGGTGDTGSDETTGDGESGPGDDTTTSGAGSSDGAPGDTTGGALTTGVATTGPSGSSGDGGPALPPDPPAGTGSEGSGDGDGTAGAADGDGTGGCGCRSTSTPTGAGWAMLVLLGALRRRWR
ncbi:MAG: S1 family peptidase [Deltaproteobacteria bacterium]|nr:S1 family peptidase [Deltaproteobacteria bacterium]